MLKINRAVHVAACALVLTAIPLVALASETTQNEDIVRHAFDTWTEGTYIFDQILAPDVVWTIHGSGPVAGTYTSIEDFVKRASVPLVSRLATPLIPQVHDLWAIGDTVIIRFDVSATTTSGAP
jgi:uncharacterized protein